MNSKHKRDAARLLRRLQTPAESRLWEALRGKQLDGWHFRRQKPLGKFIADFYCDAARLAVEVDGDIHDLPDQAAWDADRDVAFALMGITVLRVRNEEVVSDLDSVLERIRSACAASGQRISQPQSLAETPESSS